MRGHGVAVLRQKMYVRGRDPCSHRASPVQPYSLLHHMKSLNGVRQGTIRRSTLALIASSLGAVACSSDPTGRVELPAQIQACETNTAQVCGSWVLSNGQYHAHWPQGSQAVISVVRFNQDSVIFNRVDPAGTSAGMQAVYRAAPVGRSVQNGVVTWTYQGRTFSGFWKATW